MARSLPIRRTNFARESPHCRKSKPPQSPAMPRRHPTATISASIFSAGPISALPKFRMNFIGPEYFSMLRIPFVQGRMWDHAETMRAASFAVINQSMARQYWPNGDAIGHEIRTPDLDRTRPPRSFCYPAPTAGCKSSASSPIRSTTVCAIRFVPPSTCRTRSTCGHSRASSRRLASRRSRSCRTCARKSQRSTPASSSSRRAISSLKFS